MLKLSNEQGHLVLEDEKRKDGKPLDPMNLKLSESGQSMIIERDTADVMFGNPLVTEMKALSHVLPLSKNELKMATSLTDQQLYRCLSEGLKTGAICSTNEKNPKYSLSTQGY